MHVRMMEELLIPGVEHAEKANLRTEVSRVGGNHQQCLGAGAEQ